MSRRMLPVLLCIVTMVRLDGMAAIPPLTVDGVTTLLVTNYWTLFRLEKKLNSSGKFLLSRHNQISISNGLSGESLKSAKPLAGNRAKGGYAEGVGDHAKFEAITGFCQNSTHVILVDKGNHCIRTVHHISRKSSTLAGKCQLSGYKDGAAVHSQFHFPESIIRVEYENSALYLVADGANNAIRMYDLEANKVSTFVKDDENLAKPIDMILNSEGSHLYVTSSSLGLLSVNIHNKSIRKLSEIKAFSHTTRMTAIASYLYVIASHEDDTLSLYNSKTDNFTQICGAEASADCTVSGPYSLFWSPSNSTLIIGATRHVISLSISLNVGNDSELEPATWPALDGTANSTSTSHQPSETAVETVSNVVTGPNVYTSLKQEYNQLRYVAYSSLGVVLLLTVIVIAFVISRRGNGSDHRINSRYLTQRWRRRNRHPMDTLPHIATPSFTSTITLYEDCNLRRSTGASSTSSENSGHVNRLHDNRLRRPLLPPRGPRPRVDNSEDNAYMIMHRYCAPY